MSAKKGASKITEQEKERIFRMFWFEKKSHKQIAEITGRNASVISRVLSKMIFLYQEKHNRHYHTVHVSLPG